MIKKEERMTRDIIDKNISSSQMFEKMKSLGWNISNSVDAAVISMLLLKEDLLNLEDDPYELTQNVTERLLKPTRYFQTIIPSYNEQFRKCLNNRFFASSDSKKKTMFDINLKDYFDFLNSRNGYEKIGEEVDENYQDVAEEEQLIKSTFVCNRATKILASILDVCISDVTDEYLKNMNIKKNVTLSSKLSKLYSKISQNSLISLSNEKELDKFKKTTRDYYMGKMLADEYKSTDIYKSVYKILKQEINESFENTKNPANRYTYMVNQDYINITPEFLYKYEVLDSTRNDLYSVKASNIEKILSNYLRDIKYIKDKYANDPKKMNSNLESYVSNYRITHDIDDEQNKYSECVYIAYQGYNFPISFHIDKSTIKDIENKIGEKIEIGRFDSCSFKDEDGSILKYDTSFLISNNILFKYPSEQVNEIIDKDYDVRSYEEEEGRYDPIKARSLKERRIRSRSMQFLEYETSMLSSLTNFEIIQKNREKDTKEKEEYKSIDEE